MMMMMLVVGCNGAVLIQKSIEERLELLQGTDVVHL